MQSLSKLYSAIQGCRNGCHEYWQIKDEETIAKICSHLPSGSGFDMGTELLQDESTNRKIVFKTSFHHMDEYGGYDGWTEHKVIITPAFGGFHVKVTGRNKNGIKEYIADCFYSIFEL